MSNSDSCGASCFSFSDIVTAFSATYDDLEHSSQMDSSSVFPLDLTGEKGDSPLATVGDRFARIFTLVNTVSICCALSVFGIIANIINIVVFVKQGFQETINITLLAISISDLFSALTLLWFTICINPLFANANIPFLSMEIEVLTSGIPHAMAMNATGWLTAFAAFERCLCVAYPLKVRDIINRKRTLFVVVVIFVLVIAGQIPSYYVLRLGWRFVPARNKTMLGIYTIEGSELIDEITFYIVNVMAPVLSFLTVSTFSIILIIQLNLKSKWRQAAVKANDLGKEITMTSRDWKIVKMVIIVAVIFIISFTPYVLISVVMASEPQFRFYGAYRNAFAICVSIGSLMEALNAVSNTFVYYNMSSKYKALFRVTFCRAVTESDNPSKT